MTGITSRFHDGEQLIQRRAGATEAAARMAGIVHAEIPNSIVDRVRAARLVVAATATPDGRLRLTLTGGPPGFITITGPTTLHLNTAHELDPHLRADLRSDPRVGVVAMDPTTRTRVRFNGIATIVGTTWYVEGREFFGNCQKLVRLQHPIPAIGASDETVDVERVIAEAHTFFVGSQHPVAGLDASHRGCPPGALELDGATLSWKDEPGNNLFQTLGNLAVDPTIVVLIPDLARGSLVHIGGKAEIVWSGRDRSVVVNDLDITTPPYPNLPRWVAAG